jgi:hypothetical protein
MIRKRKVGTGVTRHTQISSDNPNDKEYAALSEGFICPWQRFPEWLTQYDKFLADLATKQRLPTRGDMMVIYDGANRSDWYPADYDGSEKFEDEKREQFTDPKAQRARHYLTAKDDDPAVEASWGVQWGYQSVRWHLGNLMGLALDARQALEKEQWLELAGRCIELGSWDREFKMKFTIEAKEKEVKKHINRQVKGVDAANAKKQALAEQKYAAAMEIADGMPFESRTSASAVADYVLANWTDDNPPSKARLRKHIGNAWPYLKRGQL